MPNSVISQITLPSGTTYDIKDAEARAAIAELENYTDFLGVTTTELTDGATTNPIKINGADVTAKKGNITTYGSAEFIFNGTAWQEFGDLSALGALAYKDSASGSFTPSGTVSQPTFTGSSSAVTITAQDNSNGNYAPAGTISQPTFTGGSVSSSGSFTPEGTVNVSVNTTENKTATVSKADSGTATYTPEGTVAAPTISVMTAGATASVTPISEVGTLPSFDASVSGETLTLGFSAGTLPTKGEAVTVKTGDAAYQATAPVFTGTGARLVTGNIPVPSTYNASFSGTEGNVSVSGTASGTVSQPTFTGTKVQLAGTTTAAGSVSQPTFTGTQGSVTVS